MATPTPLFDFGDPTRDGGFRPVDEGAPGSRSWGRAAVAGGVLCFDGALAPDDPGARAAVRSEPAPFDLTGAAGVALRLRGDGKRYGVELRLDDEEEVAWQATFETATGGWEVVLLPLELFTPVRQGRAAPEGGRLRPERVHTVGLLVEEQAGPFRLEVAAVAGYAPNRGVVALPRPAAP